ncbi:MAG: hypothetical protein AAF125_18755 [Chloroflexota bacterium]
MQDYTFRFVASLNGLVMLLTALLSRTEDDREPKPTDVQKPVKQHVSTETSPQ